MIRVSRRQCIFGAGSVWLGGRAAPGATVEEALPTADQVLAELRAGNWRFRTGHARHPHSSLAWLRRQARRGQHPHAAVLCCADSRVAPEILFDQGLGDLFVVRVAGNVLREDEIASLEYAVHHLQVPLCVFLAHSGCGAVRAVVDGEELPAELEHLVTPIREAAARVQGAGGADAIAVEQVRAAKRQALEANPEWAHLAQCGKLKFEAGIFRLESGSVDWV